MSRIHNNHKNMVEDEDDDLHLLRIAALKSLQKKKADLSPASISPSSRQRADEYSRSTLIHNPSDAVSVLSNPLPPANYPHAVPTNPMPMSVPPYAYSNPMPHMPGHINAAMPTWVAPGPGLPDTRYNSIGYGGFHPAEIENRPFEKRSVQLSPRSQAFVEQNNDILMRRKTKRSPSYTRSPHRSPSPDADFSRKWSKSPSPPRRRPSPHRRSPLSPPHPKQRRRSSSASSGKSMPKHVPERVAMKHRRRSKSPTPPQNIRSHQKYPSRRVSGSPPRRRSPKSPLRERSPNSHKYLNRAPHSHNQLKPRSATSTNNTRRMRSRSPIRKFQGNAPRKSNYQSSRVDSNRPRRPETNRRQNHYERRERTPDRQTKNGDIQVEEEKEPEVVAPTRNQELEETDKTSLNEMENVQTNGADNESENNNEDDDDKSDDEDKIDLFASDESESENEGRFKSKTSSQKKEDVSVLSFTKLGKGLSNVIKDLNELDTDSDKRENDRNGRDYRDRRNRERLGRDGRGRTDGFRTRSDARTDRRLAEDKHNPSRDHMDRSVRRNRPVARKEEEEDVPVDSADTWNRTTKRDRSRKSPTSGNGKVSSKSSIHSRLGAKIDSGSSKNGSEKKV